jgi:hypothetical protein
LLAEVAATPRSTLPRPGLGLASCFQAVPFQRAISAVPAEPVPTAQASLAEAAADPL